MSVTVPRVFSRPHDEVWLRIVNGHERHHFPSAWTGAEIEDWVFRQKDRESYRVLRREISIIRRKPYIGNI